MKPLMLIAAVAFIGGVLLYGKNRRNFLIFQAVMLPIFAYFFGTEVMLGKGEMSLGLWFLPFVLIWIAGTVALGVWALRHVFQKDAT